MTTPLRLRVGSPFDPGGAATPERTVGGDVPADRRMGATLRRAHSAERGQMVPMLAVFLGLFVFLGVMVIDLGLMWDLRRRAQTAADFAALAAAQDLPRNPSAPDAAAQLAQAEATAIDYLGWNGFDPLDADVTAAVSTTYDGEVDTIEVVVTRQRDWIIGGALGLAPVTVEGRAVAQTNALPRDVGIVLDRSGSMCQFTHGHGGCHPLIPGTEWQPFNTMRDAANEFATYFDPFVDGQTFDYLSLTSFSWDATLDQPLTTSYGPGSALEGAIAAMVPDGWTNVGHAIELAREEIVSNGNPLAQRVLIIVTDGEANRCPDGHGGFYDCEHAPAPAAQYALDEATLAAQAGFSLYTIGLTDNSGEPLMQEIANIGATHGSGGQFFDVDDPSLLASVFEQIADLLNVGLLE